MFTNEIDRCTCGIDMRCDIISDSENELNVKGCIAFSVSQKGNVPCIIEGNIAINGSCGQRSFPSYLGLEYIRDLKIEWLTEGIENPVPAIEIVRIYIKEKQ